MSEEQVTEDLDTDPVLKLADPLVAPTYSVIVYASSQLPSQYTALIFSKWLRSLKFGNPIYKNIKSDVFYKEFHAYLTVLLNKPGSTIRLAVLSDDHDVVLGFSVSREDVIDYIYVHKDYRNAGIGKSLMPPDAKAFIFITLTALNIWRKNKAYKHLDFNPFA